MEVTVLLGLIILIADIYAVLRIARSAASDGSKATWIAVVIVLPILGLIAWYLVGPGRPD